MSNITNLSSSVALPSGAQIPRLGFGVFLMSETDVRRCVEDALAVGYRHIDTAAVYKNEGAVGEALRASGVNRDEVFITTKVYNGDHGYQSTLDAARTSLDTLGLDYLDLYLIHWPAPGRGLYADTWRALIELKEQGLARDIGVCNFQPEHLVTIIEETGVTPAVNQVELHPAFQQKSLKNYHQEKGILTQGWGPLGQGKYQLGQLEGLTDIATDVGKTLHQVVIRWHLQCGHIIFPKTTDGQRLRQNVDVFDFELTDAHMATIDAVDVDFRLGNNPYFRN